MIKIFFVYIIKNTELQALLDQIDAYKHIEICAKSDSNKVKNMVKDLETENQRLKEDRVGLKELNNKIRSDFSILEKRLEHQSVVIEKLTFKNMIYKIICTSYRLGMIKGKIRLMDCLNG